MREVFIIGTSHSLQCGAKSCSPESVEILERVIKRILSEHRIGRIAEEASADGVKEVMQGEKARPTVCQRIVDNSLPVQFVDLGKDERAGLKLGNGNINDFALSQKTSNGEREWVVDAFSDLAAEVRERVWVARVLSQPEWPVLFVCGADHVASVKKLFTRVGVRSTVVHRDLDPDEYGQLTAD